MNSTSLPFAARLSKIIAIAAACAPLAACIVNQPLGGREDGATSPPDGAQPDATPVDAAPATREDSATRPLDVTTVTPSDDAASDPRADALTDAAAVHVSFIEVAVKSRFDLPGVGAGETSVGVGFRRAPFVAPPSGATVIERAGDCEFRESASVASSIRPSPTLSGVRIRAIAAGESVELRLEPTVDDSDTLASYSAKFASALAPGTVVRLEIDAFSNVPSFSREIVVTQARYVAPTPVTENADNRFLTRTAGQPMPVAFEHAGGAHTQAVFSVVMTRAPGVPHDLTCVFPAGRSTTTVATSLLDRAAPFASGAVGGATVLLSGSSAAPPTTLPGGATVTVSSGSLTFAALRI